jgi:hypothetical protein
LNHFTVPVLILLCALVVVAVIRNYFTDGSQHADLQDAL